MEPTCLFLYNQEEILLVQQVLQKQIDNNLQLLEFYQSLNYPQIGAFEDVKLRLMLETNLLQYILTRTPFQ